MNESKPKRAFKKKILDYKQTEPIFTTFDEIYAEFKRLMPVETLNGASQKLSTRYPQLKHSIHKYFNYYESLRACIYCVYNNISEIPKCSIDKVTPCEYIGGSRGFKKTASINSITLKRTNKQAKLLSANIIPFEEFNTLLRKVIEGFNNYQNLKQSIFKINPDLVKSVYHYTSEIKGIKRFSERCYILLNGRPEKSNSKIKLHYQSFNQGYHERFKYSNESKGENEIREFINTLDIQTSKMRDKYEIDIFIPSKNIGVEYNGEYFHSFEFKGKDYHSLKTMYFLNKGIQLIHIFETEWYNKQDIVKSILSMKLGVVARKIYARKCEVCEITSDEKRRFLNDNHIQGDDKSFSYIGLKHEGELVSVMTLCKRKITGKLTIEMSRFCSSLNTQVIGGASRLLKHLLRKHREIEMVTTYADIRYSASSNTYEKLGFTLSHKSDPDYFYFKPAISQYCKLYHRSNFMKHKLVSKLAIFDATKTEFENMDINGWKRIYDCGNKVYKMINPFYATRTDANFDELVG